MEENSQGRLRLEVPQDMNGSLIMWHPRGLHELAEVLNRKGNVGSGVGKEIKLANELSVSCGIRIQYTLICLQLETAIQGSNNSCQILTMELLEEVQGELPLG